jgi:hypothetical protein
MILINIRTDSGYLLDFKNGQNPNILITSEHLHDDVPSCSGVFYILFFKILN